MGAIFQLQIRGYYKESEQSPSSDTDVLKKTKGEFLIYVIYAIQENTVSNTKEEIIYIKRDCMGLKMIAG